jgi:hypothetical protein
MSTIEQDASKRRNYKQGGCEYLLNDEERTAWVAHSYILSSYAQTMYRNCRR